MRTLAIVVLTCLAARAPAAAADLEANKLLIRDYHDEIQQLVAEDDWVVSRIQFTGTNDGPYDGRPATGNKLVFSTCDFYRIENGKIAERWDVVETLARAVALGLVSAPKAASPTPPKSP